MDSDSELKLFSLISELIDENPTDSDSRFKALIIEIVSLICLMDLKSQPKPESKLMSLVTQAIHVFYSMSLESQPKHLSQFISIISQLVNSVDSDSERNQDLEKLDSLLAQALYLGPEPELISLIYQIFYHVIPMNAKWGKLISLCPQVEVNFKEGKFSVKERIPWNGQNKVFCLPFNWKKYRLPGEDTTHIFCLGCYGKNHEEYNKAPLVVKHPIHPRHSLRLVLYEFNEISRECYCCDEDLKRVFYYCAACDFAMNIACVGKPPILAIDHPRRHQHKLALFPRLASLTCNVCAVANSSFAIYMCPPCDFFVHRICIDLPRVIRISRHPHRISFTPFFDQGDRSCGVCRTNMDSYYGGFSCIKDGCSYAAHSRCATQRNVWDGKELEGEPEETEEEDVEPFIRISNGIIQHFSHQQHNMHLDDNTGRDYDETKQCQACVTPIYFGNFYSCTECDFIIHEDCAKLSRKIFHPTHPHLLTLVGGYDGVLNYQKDYCSACLLVCTSGFFYECGKEECRFKLHVQCATISEPLVHDSHMHSLFLTSKPGELIECTVCISDNMETFNCMECNFALCFRCATIPQKARYKHDKHMLTFSYGEKANTGTYWCEVCERKLDVHRRFYKCDEYCCVTIHMECLIGKHLYMKPGSSWNYRGKKIEVLPNNLCMYRPICSFCKGRCRFKIVFQCYGFVFCSIKCIQFQLF